MNMIAEFEKHDYLVLKSITICLALVLLAGCRSASDTFSSPFSDYLNYGPYAVGFKTVFTTDLSRRAVPYSDWGGRLYSEEGQVMGRRLPLHIWYPAVRAGEVLHIEHYIGLITRQLGQHSISRDDSLPKFIYINQVNELRGDSGFTQRDLDTILSLQTNAYLNAPPVKGTFPLVIFPNGTSPANQSVMCEFLASHGYVMAGFPLKGQYSYVLDATVRGLEVGVDDLQFGLQRLLELPNVNRNEIALIANAIESSFCAALASRNKMIDALISLEGGFLSQFEQRILNETNFYEPQSVTVPILAIYAPHPHISPDFIAHLKYSQRYFAHFPGMTEFHFLNFGVFEEYVPGIIGEKKGDTRQGIKAASELILAFLDAQLKNQTTSLDQIYAEGNMAGFEQEIDTLWSTPGFTAPPNLAILKNHFVTRGMPAIDSIYGALSNSGDPQPFSISFYEDFRNWLAWKKDPEYVHRKQLYKMAVESFPNSALNRYYLAMYSERTGDIESSRMHYLRTRDLLEIDDSIDQELKVELENAIDEALK